jgi:membrane protein YqaA with SNARE-associated domain
MKVGRGKRKKRNRKQKKIREDSTSKVVVMLSCALPSPNSYLTWASGYLGISCG